MSTFLERRRFNEAYAHTQRKTLIQESIKQVKQVYLDTDKITPEEFTELKAATETNSAKYIFRITKWYVDGNKELDLDSVSGVLDWFEKNSNNLENGDIAQYKSFDELEKEQVKHQQVKSTYDMTDVNLIFEDDEILICQPLSNIATNNLASDMPWCTSPKNSKQLKAYFEEGDRFVYVFNKTATTITSGKYCIQ